jgi:tetratricopeptide (TPR) repeat protein
VTVNGDIVAGGSTLRDWTIELVSFSPAAAYRTVPQEDGFFEFRGVAPGIYDLRVTDSRENVLYTQVVSVGREKQTFCIRLPATDPAEGSKAQTVSFQELQHKVPRKAISEHNKGVSALKKRQLSAAADHLKNAVAIDPEFADAQNNLGIAYFRLKEYGQSVEHLQRAVELAPGNQHANDNLCLLLLRLKRYAEAGRVADRVLKHGSGSAVAHYAIAVSVIAEGGNIGGALEHLRSASDEIPKGHLLAARVLANAGRRIDAAHELEAYLRSPETGSERPEVEEWLAELKQY